MRSVKVWPIHWGRFWFAVRLKWTNFCIGVALDWEDRVWLVIRLGPLHFDVVYGDRPNWC